MMNQRTQPRDGAQYGGAECRPPSQVESNQQFIDDALKRLEETANHLMTRLNPVMPPGSPAIEGKGSPNKIAEILVPVAQRSSDQARHIQRVNDQLTDILQRLAV